MSCSYNPIFEIGMILSKKEYDAILNTCIYDEERDRFIGNDGDPFMVVQVDCDTHGRSFVPFILNGRANIQNEESSLYEQETWYFIPMEQKTPMSVNYYFQKKKLCFEDIVAYYCKKIKMNLNEIIEHTGFVSYVAEC